jgi:hypothetical protein
LRYTRTMPLTNIEIQKSISELPDNIKNAVINFDWATEILDIAHEHNIQIDEADIFRQQTLLVILGKSSAESYEKKLMAEMNIPKSLATSLVDEANHRIFFELQKRAFSKDELEDLEQNDDDLIYSDRYHEPINHSDVKNILKNEGVELIDEEPKIHDEDLHNEISAILQGTDTPITAPKRENSSLNVSANAHASNKQNDYHEPIETSDLKGIKTNSVDTSILRKQYQTTPEKIFSEEPTQSQKITGRDLGQGNTIISKLDKHIMENPFIAKTDASDVSPSKEEQIREEGDFLEHLNKDEY